MDVSSFFISIVAIWGSICLLVVGFQLFGLRDSWVVWAPPLVGGLMQGAVVVLGVFFLCCRFVPCPVIRTVLLPYCSSIFHVYRMFGLRSGSGRRRIFIDVLLPSRGQIIIFAARGSLI